MIKMENLLCLRTKKENLSTRKETKLQVEGTESTKMEI
jgi:hypothetical protein